MDKTNLFIVAGGSTQAWDMKRSVRDRLSTYILSRLRIILATRPVDWRGHDIRRPNNLMILAYGWANSPICKSEIDWNRVCLHISMDRYRILDLDFSVTKVSSWMAKHLGLALVDGV